MTGEDGAAAATILATSFAVSRGLLRRLRARSTAFSSRASLTGFNK
jgi:hypothetical protein